MPSWLKSQDNYIPKKDHHQFIYKTLDSLSSVMSKIRIQKGHEKNHVLPSILKLIITICLILLISISQSKIILMMISAMTLLYLCLWPGDDLLHLFKSALLVGLLSMIILLPAMIINHALISNDLRLILKVMLSITILNIFNHTTQWNHITADLKKLHIPSIFIFTLDITLKFIILLGQLIQQMLISLKLRSVGESNQKYQSIGGIMGNTFIKGMEMNQQMYQAMVCRCFTNDYKGL